VKKNSALCLLLFTFWSCLPKPGAKIVPGAGLTDVYSIRFTVFQGNEKQSGRLHWQDDGNRARLVVFGPLNQVVFELFVQDEVTLLMERSRREFWQGSFQSLLSDLWAMELSYEELRAIFNNREKTIDNTNLRVECRRDAHNGEVVSALVKSDDVTLQMLVTRRQKRPGNVASPPGLRDYFRRDLAEIISRKDFTHD